jgi:DNA-3-methyladenine glycosylase II
VVISLFSEVFLLKSLMKFIPNIEGLGVIETLTPETYQHALQFLADSDRDLAQILQRLGPPPLWEREPGFPTLVHIILEQQVSLASALAAFKKLQAVVAPDPLTPAHFLKLDATQLKTSGFSRQKALYSQLLAQAILDSQLDLEGLAGLDDVAARKELVKLKGIGLWTADIYLLMALRRPDVWPKGDLALILAMQKMKGLAARPIPEQMETLSVSWQPYRAVAARLLWHFYLNPPNKSK